MPFCEQSLCHCSRSFQMEEVPFLSPQHTSLQTICSHLNMRNVQVKTHLNKYISWYEGAPSFFFSFFKTQLLVFQMETQLVVVQMATANIFPWVSYTDTTQSFGNCHPPADPQKAKAHLNAISICHRSAAVNCCRPVVGIRWQRCGSSLLSGFGDTKTQEEVPESREWDRRTGNSCKPPVTDAPIGVAWC